MTVLGSASRRAALTAAALTAFAHVPAWAQVIEIADDGVATTYAGPTRFVSAAPEALGAATSAALASPARSDPYDRAAKQHNVDVALLRAVAWRESRGNNRAVSPKGALGTMQLMPATARALGVDPSDEEANIAGGAAYLAQQLGRFAGSVPLALAAYNAGPGAVLRFNGIPPFAETQAYVAAIMHRWQGPLLASAALAARVPAVEVVARASKRPTILSLMIEVPTP